MTEETELPEVFNFKGGRILLFDKPYGWTSFDLVKKVRNSLYRRLKIKKLKVGHAGTLDPLATGLMILCTGKATKQIDKLQAEEKEYQVAIKLGATTPSFDLETNEDLSFPIDHITENLIKETFKQFTGNILQVPPVFSAVKIDGKRAYEYARKGHDPELKPKKIVIKSIELISIQLPTIIVRMTCSKGTYVRAFARDLGNALNSGAYLTALRRTRIGNYSVDEAKSVDAFLEEISPI